MCSWIDVKIDIESVSLSRISQLRGVIFTPYGTFDMSGGIFGCHNL